MGTLTTLERPLYTVGEAARLLHLNAVTLKRWLDGATRKGKFYEPVIRPEHTGDDAVTWGEFVEAGYLHQYRTRGFRLQELRPVVDRLRKDLGVRYPLAHAQPYAGGKELVRRIQDEEGLDEALWMVVSSPGGQLMLADHAERFLERVTFDGDLAAKFKPDGPTSPVEIDPTMSFGVPTVEGVRTENVVELFRAGESIGAIADAFDITVAAVEAAIRYEAAA